MESCRNMHHLIIFCFYSVFFFPYPRFYKHNMPLAHTSLESFVMAFFLERNHITTPHITNNTSPSNNEYLILTSHSSFHTLSYIRCILSCLYQHTYCRKHQPVTVPPLWHFAVSIPSNETIPLRHYIYYLHCVLLLRERSIGRASRLRDYSSPSLTMMHWCVHGGIDVLTSIRTKSIGSSKIESTKVRDQRKGGGSGNRDNINLTPLSPWLSSDALILQNFFNTWKLKLQWAYFKVLMFTELILCLSV